jgi:hypothetical protein
MTAPQRAARPLFMITIVVGSFLLFMVQPMVARAALPRLGGAPNVWNSAMLVYQALLLGGYAYAHWLGRFSVRVQAVIHVSLLALAALTLPVHLVPLAPPTPGWEALWVPALFALSIGPVFFVVSAQAPLMQRWYSSDLAAGDPYALYAASNFGSFAGLIAYPLVLEPLLPLQTQALVWAGGFALLVVLVAASAWARRHSPAVAGQPESASGEGVADEPVTRSQMLLWLALGAVPSGLMLSTTTFLTTDIVAMPLLWVIPLGLYLLSFVVAFATNRTLANWISRIAPLVLLVGGGFSISLHASGSLAQAGAAVVLLFVVAVALHTRLNDTRPSPRHLTLFYIMMSAGGALGGVFCALIAPLVFDWVWEHPILLVASALLVPRLPLQGWMRTPELAGRTRLLSIVLLMACAFALALGMLRMELQGQYLTALFLAFALTICGVMVAWSRWAFVAVLLLMLVGRGGMETIITSLSHARTRSYFGIYTVRESEARKARMLNHGTTLHGLQWTDAARHQQPTTYYGPTGGAGLALLAAGERDRVGVVGLGTATLACYKRPAQVWTFFEIDPVVADISRKQHRFTFLDECAPQSPVVIGDARLELARIAPGSFDVLLVDAFSSDSIPLHLITREALGVYARSLAPDGVMLMHISNRFLDLRPVVAELGAAQGWAVRLRDDAANPARGINRSYWVAMAPTPARLDRLAAHDPAHPWIGLKAPDGAQAWTDDRSSILPYVRWDNIFRM